MMENKFTPRAEEALRLAQEAAEDMGHGYVGSEHLLLGLLREEEGIAHRVLEENGLTDELVCDILHRSVGTGVSGAAPSQGLTPRAKSAVELAVSEAARTGAGAITGIHPRVAELVVAGPLVFVGEHLVGLVDLFKLGLGVLVPGV